MSDRGTPVGAHAAGSTPAPRDTPIAIEEHLARLDLATEFTSDWVREVGSIAWTEFISAPHLDRPGWSVAIYLEPQPSDRPCWPRIRLFRWLPG